MTIYYSVEITRDDDPDAGASFYIRPASPLFPSKCKTCSLSVYENLCKIVWEEMKTLGSG